MTFPTSVLYLIELTVAILAQGTLQAYASQQAFCMTCRSSTPRRGSFLRRCAFVLSSWLFCSRFGLDGTDIGWPAGCVEQHREHAARLETSGLEVAPALP